MDTISQVSVDDFEGARQRARIDVAAAYRQAVVDDYQEGISNHFTLNVPGRPGRFYLNQYGMHWSEVTAGSLMEVTYEGDIMEGHGIADQTAVCIHAPIHKLVPDAECVMHTHMPYCTALTQLEDMTLEMTGQSALYFNGKVAYDYNYNGWADDQSEGERLAGLMDGKPILMLANHGVVVVGKSVASAYYRLYYLERACRTQLFSMWTGQRRRFVTQEILEKMASQVSSPSPDLKMSSAEYMFAALKRGLDRSMPGYEA
jgi:ribulose-5-phosphate 4-epimerase/fuculose-1-phosphate aldolase